MHKLWSLFVCCWLASAGPNCIVATAFADNRQGSINIDFFFHLAVVPDQTVTGDWFDVQVIAEPIEPDQPLPAIKVIDANGTAYPMTRKRLKWPGTNDDSVYVHAAMVKLAKNAVNRIRVVAGNKEISLAIKQKPTLVIKKASNPIELIAHVKEGIGNPEIDVIEIAYDEPDLGRLLNNVGNNLGRRKTWLTLTPAAGKLVGWARNSGLPLSRPKVDYLHLHRVVFGSDSSDGGGGQFYTEKGHNIWLNGVEFRAKYKHTWPKQVPMTAVYQPDVRVFAEEGQKVYFTDCLWDGTAATAATSSVALARDLRFVSHRGDFNNFGKVFLNVLAQNISTIRNSAGSDYLHNDGFQIWGRASDIVFMGFRVISPNIPAELQPFLFDRTFSPDYSRILVDTVIVEGAPPNVLRAQLAGALANSRISNLSIPAQSLSIRQDFTEPNGAFKPMQVFFHKATLRSVEYLGPGGVPIFGAGKALGRGEIASRLNERASLTGMVATEISIAPGLPMK